MHRIFTPYVAVSISHGGRSQTGGSPLWLPTDRFSQYDIAKGYPYFILAVSAKKKTIGLCILRDAAVKITTPIN
jgi:hypothetical protein